MTRTVESAFGLLALLTLAACYNTINIKNGGLVCGPNDACPDGFVCLADAPGGKHCWKSGTGPDAGGSVSPDTSSSKTDTSTGPACTTATPPFGPFATCSTEVAIGVSTCDPVCQSHCPCDRRCVINQDTWASFQCEATAPAVTSLVPVQGTCSGANSLACAPGSVCIADDVCPWLCFQTCRKDLDCPANSRCSAIAPYDKTSHPVPNVFLCTPPTESCNPSGAASCSTARASFNCVFLAGLTGVANTDSTICDCATSHVLKVGATGCSTLPDDCQPGAVCVDGTCRQICDKRASGGACTNGGGCNTIYGSTTYGYCR